MLTGVSRSGVALQDIAALRAAPALCLLLVVGCLGGAGRLPEAAPPAPPAAPDAVRVRLVFEADVDLDLYVTGPSQETIYFANESSREGGRLDEDRRCRSRAPRVETVVFPTAPGGSYRVGVDFQHRCDGADRAPYLLIVDAPGQATREVRGEIEFGRFDPRVVEFRVAGTGD